MMKYTGTHNKLIAVIIKNIENDSIMHLTYNGRQEGGIYNSRIILDKKYYKCFKNKTLSARNTLSVLNRMMYIFTLSK